MPNNLAQTITSQWHLIAPMIALLNAIIHILFAGAVARDTGAIQKQGQSTILVSGLTWAFATLLGGVIVATIYWLLHHLNWTRLMIRDGNANRS